MYAEVTSSAPPAEVILTRYSYPSSAALVPAVIVSAVAAPEVTPVAAPVLPYTPPSSEDVMLTQRSPVAVLRCHCVLSAEESLDAAVTVSALVVTGSLRPVSATRS